MTTVQRDQCSGHTLACVNCSRPLGKRHDLLCHAGAVARNEARAAQRAAHDCVTGRCDTDPRTPPEIEAEGHTAGLAGASYDDCPYGHTHADIRFSPWQQGRWKARGEWCDNHRQPFSWCPGFPDMDMDAAEGPCSDRPAANDGSHAHG